MKKHLALCLLTVIAVQAEEVAPAVEEVAPVIESPAVSEQTTKNQSDVVAQLKQSCADIQAMKAEIIAVLTTMIQELQGVDTTRGIDFSAYNNLRDMEEAERYQSSQDDDDEGSQE